MTFTSLDVIFGVLVLLFAIHGLVRGFVTEVMSVAQWFLGLLLAFVFFRPVSAWLEEKYLAGHEPLARVLAFAGIFIVVFAVILIFGKMLKNIVEGMKFGGLDHFFGAILGVLEGLLVVALALWILEIQPFADMKSLYGDSFSFRFLEPFLRNAEKTVPGIMGGSNV